MRAAAAWAPLWNKPRVRREEREMADIRRAGRQDMGTVSALVRELWPNHEPDELEAEFARQLDREDAAVFLCLSGGRAVGFAQVSLRRDYVEGTDGRPVGYLEGIYVQPPYRRHGLARALLEDGREFARQHGCKQFASDCELDNEGSIAFHLSCGFAEANRIVCFVSSL